MKCDWKIWLKKRLNMIEYDSKQLKINYWKIVKNNQNIRIIKLI